MMIDVREVLRRRGVAGVLKAAGCRSDGADELARECDGDLGRFWREIPHAGFMCQIADALGVPVPEVLDAVAVAVERLVVETGANCQHPQTAKLMGLCRAALSDPDVGGHAEGLMTAIHTGAQALPRGVHQADAQSCEILVLSAAMALTQAVWAYVCPCGTEHQYEREISIAGCLTSCTYARKVHAMAVGRIPARTSQSEAFAWSNRWTANHVRDLLPVETLMARRFIEIPGVNPEGERITSRRPRGKA